MLFLQLVSYYAFESWTTAASPIWETLRQTCTICNHAHVWMHILAFIFYHQNSCNSEAVLSNRYPLKQLWGQKNEMHVGYFEMIDLSWLNQPSTLVVPVSTSISGQLKKMKKKWVIWGVDRMKGQIWWEFVQRNGDVLFWVIWKIAFYPRWLNSRQGDIDQMSHLIFSSHITLSHHFLFLFFSFWEETLWISWFN